MQSDNHNHDHAHYGPWTWIVGFAFGALIIWIMFALATGFA